MAVGRMHGGQKDKEGEKEEQKGRRQVPGEEQASAVLALGRLKGSSLHGGLINIGSTGVS